MKLSLLTKDNVLAMNNGKLTTKVSHLKREAEVVISITDKYGFGLRILASEDEAQELQAKLNTVSPLTALQPITQ